MIATGGECLGCLWYCYEFRASGFGWFKVLGLGFRLFGAYGSRFQRFGSWGLDFDEVTGELHVQGSGDSV